MQKDLNVISLDELTVGDDIYISLVLTKSSNETTADFSFFFNTSTDMVTYTQVNPPKHRLVNPPKLKLVNYLTNEEIKLESYNHTLSVKPNYDNPEEYEKENRLEFIWRIKTKQISNLQQGLYEATASFYKNKGNWDDDDRGTKHNKDEKAGPIRFKVASASKKAGTDQPLKVSLSDPKRISSSDQLLWILIRNRTIDFNRYKGFMDRVMCDDKNKPNNRSPLEPIQQYAYANRLPYHNAASYSLLKYATEYYLMQECGLVPQGLYDAEGDINWDELNNEIISGKVLEDELGRTQRSGLDLSELKNNYLEELNGDGGYALPYFNLIREKLQEVPLKEPHELPNIVLTLSNYDRYEETINFPTDGLQLAKACYGISKSKLLGPCMIELLWSYWHEESGLVQTMNAISRRFQNIRSNGERDPLANFNLDPLRPLSNLLWGYIEDERNRLSITRRNLEYQYEYGLSLIGKAVSPIGVAEHRTQFIRAFHSLLKACLDFYSQANFTTVVPDAFPLLNHLREVHLLLAEGAHNQYGDLAWTSRIEMLSQQWLLSRPEMREFIGSRIMVPYTEAWMDKVDTMKQLQDWKVPNVTHFHDLAVFGEQLLLSIRFGSWNSTIGVGGTNAGNWAHYWRNEVQRYVHAYQAVTGVDLSADTTETRRPYFDEEDKYVQPALLIQKHVALQRSRQAKGLQQNRVQPALSAQMRQPARAAGAIAVSQKKLNG